MPIINQIAINSLKSNDLNTYYFYIAINKRII